MSVEGVMRTLREGGSVAANFVDGCKALVELTGGAGRKEERVASLRAAGVDPVAREAELHMQIVVADVVNFLKAHVAQADACEWGCVALRNLSAVGFEAALVNAGAPKVCVEALTIFTEHSEVVEAALFALSNSVVGDAERLKAIIDAGSVSAAVAALRSQTEKKNAKSSEAAAKLLRDIAAGPYEDALVEANAPAALCSALTTFVDHAAVCEHALIALRNTAVGNTAWLKSIVDAGAVSAAVAALRSHTEKSNTKPSEAASRLLRLIAEDSSYEDALVEANAPAALCSALTTFFDHAAVCEHVLWALRNTAVGNIARLKAIVDGGAVSAAVAALRMHLETKRAPPCEAAIRLLMIVSAGPFSLASFAGALFAAIREFPGNAIIVETAVATLGNISNSKSNARTVFDLGAVPLLIGATAHKDPNVFTVAMRSLARMCRFLEESRAACVGILSPLVPLLTKNRDSTKIALAGTQLLCNLAVDEEGAIACVSANVFPLALQFLNLHRDGDKDVCELASRLISRMISRVAVNDALIAIPPLVSALSSTASPAGDALRHIALNSLGIDSLFKEFIALCTVGKYDIAKDLCRCLGSRLVSAPASEEGHEGENCLHIALKSKDAPLDFITELVECARDRPPTEGRASSKLRRVDGDDTFGEYPLSLAAALGRADAVGTLLTAGADAIAQDSKGFTVMHIAVKYSSSAVIRLLAMRAPELWDIVNDRGYCPIVYAASLDTAEGTKVFEELLELRRIRKRRFANTTSWLYPLASIDEVASSDPRAEHLQATHVAKGERLMNSTMRIYDVVDAQKKLDAPLTNSVGRPVHLSNGRYYCGFFCGQDAYASGCTSCDGTCGPADGCACGPCHELNIAHSMYVTASCVAGMQLSARISEARAAEHHERMQSILPKNYAKRWPRRSLLDMLAENPLNNKDGDGVCKTDFMKRLVSEKWSSYGESRMKTLRYVTYAYLTALTVVAFLHATPAVEGAPLLLPNYLARVGFGQSAACSAGEDGGILGCTLLVAAESFVVLGACARAHIHVKHFLAWRAKRTPSVSILSDYATRFSSTYGAAFFNIGLTIVYVPAVAMLAILSAFGRVDTIAYHIILAGTCIMSWGSLLWFMMGESSQAEFVVSLGSMLTEDLPNYLALSFYLFCGFTSAFFVVGRYNLDELLSLAGSTFTIILDNGDDFPEPAAGERIELEPFRVVFLVVVSLVLVNMLVALMGKTLDRVKDVAEVQAVLEKGRILSDFERDECEKTVLRREALDDGVKHHYWTTENRSLKGETDEARHPVLEWTLEGESGEMFEAHHIGFLSGSAGTRAPSVASCKYGLLCGSSQRACLWKAENSTFSGEVLLEQPTRCMVDLRAMIVIEEGAPSAGLFAAAHWGEGVADAAIAVYDIENRLRLHNFVGFEAHVMIALTGDILVCAGRDTSSNSVGGAGSLLNQILILKLKQDRKLDTANGFVNALSCAREALVADHTERVTTLAPLPDGRFLSGSLDKTIRLWSTSTNGGARVWASKKFDHPEPVRALSSYLSSYIVTGMGNDVVVWKGLDADKLELDRTLSGHVGPITALHFVSKSSYLFSGSEDTTLRVWKRNTEDSDETCEAALLGGHKSAVTSIAAIFDGSSTGVVTSASSLRCRISHNPYTDSTPPHVRALLYCNPHRHFRRLPRLRWLKESACRLRLETDAARDERG